MTDTSIGLYLGSEVVDLACLKGTYPHPRLAHWGRMELPPVGAWWDQIRPEEPGLVSQIAQVVRSLLRGAELSSPRIQVHLAVAAEATIIRYFQMPTIPIRERRMAVLFEARKYLPFKPEELVTDFQIVIHRTDPNLMRVMYFGIKRNTLTPILSMLESVGVVPLSLEVAPISLIRLLRQTGQLPGTQVATVLSVERGTATINIAREDLLYLSRNVTILPSAEPSSTEETLSNELQEALVNETRVSIDYYRRRFLGEPAIGRVILCGKTLDPARVKELTSALDLPVEPAEPFRRMAKAGEAPSGLGVATGLALRGLERKEEQINLLPLEQRREMAGILKPVARLAAAACLALAVGFGGSLFDLSRLEQRAASLRQGQIQITGLRPNLNPAELTSFLERQKAETRFLNQLQKNRQIPSSVLLELARLLPEEAWIQHALLEDRLKAQPQGPLGHLQRSRTLKLVGRWHARNRDRELQGTNQFVENLKSNSFFQSAFKEFQLDSVQRSRFLGEETTEFRVTCASGRPGE